jgi:hypothetical protein
LFFKKIYINIKSGFRGVTIEPFGAFASCVEPFVSF